MSDIQQLDRGKVTFSRAFNRKTKMTDVVPLFFVVLLCLGFFALWNWDLGYHSFSEDEWFVAHLAAEPAGEILRQLNSDEPHPPVYFLLMHAWCMLLGSHHEFLMRYPSLLIGVLLLSLTYRLGRDLGLGWPAALVPVLALGFNPQVTVQLRETRMYGAMITSLAFAVLIGLRFERLPRRAAIWIAAMASLTALLTHYFNILFVAALGLWGALALDGEGRRRWLLSQAIAWGLLALWLPLMGRGFFNLTDLSQGKTWSFTLPPWDTLARLVKVGTFGYRDIPGLQLTLLGGGLLVGGWLIGGLYGRDRQRWLLLLGVVAPLVTFALLGWFKPLFHPKYMLPWLLFPALALGRLVARWHWLGGSVVLALLALMALPTWQTVQMPYDGSGGPPTGVFPGTQLSPVPRQLGQYLVEYAGPTDVFGLGTPDVVHCYYATRHFERDLGCVLIPEYPTQPVDELERQIGELLAEHDVLWYLDYYNPCWDPHRVADEALARSALSLGTEKVKSADRRLRLYTSSQTILRQQQAIGARFGKVAELEGIWLMRGTDLHLALVWRSLADHPPVMAKVFVHLLDGAGQIVDQKDGIPVWWTRPLETWRLDEQLLDVYTLFLPADANVTDRSLRIGLYDPDTLIRLPAYDQAGALLPDDAVSVPLAGW